MVTLRLEAVGTQALVRTLKRYQDAVLDLREPFEQVADRFAQMELAQFTSQGAASGDPWAPLSPGYAAWKERRYPGRPILVRTGQLRRDLTRRPFGVEAITSDEMRLGTSLRYARYHQTGTPRMPRRRPIDLTELQKRELVKIVQRWIVESKPNTPRSR